MNTLTRLLAVLAVVLLAHQGLATSADAAPRRATGHIVAAGDSTTQGVGAPAGQSWPDHLQATCGRSCTVSNQGHGGQCLVAAGCGYGPTLLQTFDQEVLTQNPRSAVILVGRNDLCHATTDQIIDAYQRLRGRARNAGVNLYIGTITPAGAGWPWPCEDQRVEVNQRLRQMPNVIDLEALVINQRGLLRWVYDSGDGVHLNAEGYRVLGQAVAREVW